MFCPNCGSQVEYGDLFCGNCGEKLEWDGMSQAEPVEPEPVKTTKQQEAPRRPGEEEVRGSEPPRRPQQPQRQEEPPHGNDRQPKKNGGAIAIIAGGVIVVAVIVCAVLFAMKSKFDENPEENDKVEMVQENQKDEETGTDFTSKPDKEEVVVPEEKESDSAEKGEKTDDDSSVVAVIPGADDKNSKDAQPEAGEIQTTFIEGQKVLELAASYQKLGTSNVADYTSSSVIKQDNGVTNPPINLFDGDDKTNWQEGVDGPGIGEYVYYTFDREYMVSALTFHLGNWKESKYFYGNNRPKTLVIAMGDESWVVEFPDAWEEYGIEFSAPVKADDLRLTISEVYQGTDWDDTPITDVNVWYKQ